MVRDVPVPAIGIRVDCTIELNGASEPVPFVIPIIRVAEAQHLIDLSAGSTYFDVRFELNKEVRISKLVLSDVKLEVHCILIDVVGVLT